jgi:antitoxin MazE
MGFPVNARVQKWGNSLAIRIPRPFAAEVGLAESSEVELSLEEGRLVIKPQQRARYELAELLAMVAPESRHDEVDWGRPVGKEEW